MRFLCIFFSFFFFLFSFSFFTSRLSFIFSLTRFFLYARLLPHFFFTYVNSLFPSISSFSLRANVVSFLLASRTLSHSERVQRGKERGGTCNYMYAPGLPASRLRRCVKPGNWFGTRNRARRTSRWQTARLGCTLHLHVVATPSAEHGVNNSASLPGHL